MRPDYATEIVQRLRQHGHEAYFVGGCVRDMVMGVEPSDYDVATSAKPEEIIALFPRTEAIGAQFGVILVIHRGQPIEVATFRSDQAYVDGRRPTGVVFTTAQEDVSRRDFTMNGLLYDPVDGRVLDYVGGRLDIDARIVRAIGDPRRRFDEDKLRVLRAVRFAARFDYSIEPATWQAVQEMAPQIHQVSAERIHEELLRILTEGHAGRGGQMLHASGLLREIIPEVHWSAYEEVALAHLPERSSPALAMAVLLSRVAPDQVRMILERLRCSREEIDSTHRLVRVLPSFRDATRLSLGGLKRLFQNPSFEEHLVLLRIARLAAGEPLDDYAFARSRFDAMRPEEISPRPVINGEDLIAMGYARGPIFGKILAAVEEEQLEERIQDRAAALSFVREKFGASLQ